MDNQVNEETVIESNENTQAVGFVTSTEGATVVVVSSDGSLRELNPGDPVHEGDVLQVTDGTHVVLTFADGSVRQLSSGGTFEINQGNYHQLSLVEGYEEENPEFQDLLAALEAGEDISEEQEATAAGESGSSGDEIGQGLQFLLNGGEVTPTAGIDPNYIPPPLVDPTADTDVADSLPSVSVSVQVEIDVQEPPTGGEPPTTPTPDYPVVVSGNAASILEGTSEGGKQITFILQLDQPFSQDVEVTYELKPLTADNPEDWFDGDLINTVTIPAGSTEFPVTVTIVEDHFDEGNETFEIMILSASNATVNPASDTATVTIFDDDTTPEANQDTNWLQAEAGEEIQDFPSTSGNVLASSDHPGDPSDVLAFSDQADTDVDGDTLKVINIQDADENLTVSDGTTSADGTVITGLYGTLTIGADGTYEYVAGPLTAQLTVNEQVEDVFTYTVSDGYNTPQTTTLTITIFGGDSGVEISGETDLLVDEDGLEGALLDAGRPGEVDSTESSTDTGSFVIDAPDGVSSLTIEGNLIISDGVLVADPSFATSIGNTFTVTGYDSDTGLLSYKYELNGNVDHLGDDTEDTISESFFVVLTDTDGDTTDTTITAEIIDDIPTVDIEITSFDVAVDGSITGGGTLTYSGGDAPLTLTSLVVEVDGNAVNATDNGDGTWSIDGGQTTTYNENSTYNVTADAEVTDNDGDTATDGDTSSDATPTVAIEITSFDVAVDGSITGGGTLTYSGGDAPLTLTSLVVEVDGNAVNATDNGDGTWSIDGGQTTTYNENSTYNVTADAEVTDNDGDTATDGDTSSDATPTVAIEITSFDVAVDGSITGGGTLTYSGGDAPLTLTSLVVEVDGNAVNATDNGDGTWSIDGGQTTTYNENSTYNVTADAEVTDNDGDTATDGDTSSDATPTVAIEITSFDVAVDGSITGGGTLTYSGGDAPLTLTSLVVEVDGNAVNATDNGDGTWSIDGGQTTTYNENSTYNVTADAEVTDNDGDTATDGDTSSDATPTVAIEITSFDVAVDGSITGGGTLTYSGGDAPLTLTSLVVEVDGNAVNATDNGDGTWSIDGGQTTTYNENSTYNVTADAEVTDNDGDTATDGDTSSDATPTVAIEITSFDVAVDGSITGGGTLTYSGGDAPLTLTSLVVEVDGNAVNATDNGDGTWSIDGGQTTTYNENSTYNVTADAEVTDNDGDTATDGDTSSDATPTVAIEITSFDVAVDGSITGGGTLTYSGGDAPLTLTSLVVEVDGNAVNATDNGDGTWSIDGGQTTTYNENSTYNVTADAEVTDNDGDTATDGDTSSDATPTVAIEITSFDVAVDGSITGGGTLTYSGGDAPLTLTSLVVEVDGNAVNATDNGDGTWSIDGGQTTTYNENSTYNVTADAEVTDNDGDTATDGDTSSDATPTVAIEITSFDVAVDGSITGGGTLTYSGGDAPLTLTSLVVEVDGNAVNATDNGDGTWSIDGGQTTTYNENSTYNVTADAEVTDNDGDTATDGDTSSDATPTVAIEITSFDVAVDGSITGGGTLTYSGGDAPLTLTSLVVEVDGNAVNATDNGDGTWSIDGGQTTTYNENSTYNVTADAEVTDNDGDTATDGDTSSDATPTVAIEITSFDVAVDGSITGGGTLTYSGGDAPLTLTSLVVEVDGNAVNATDNGDGTWSIDGGQTTTYNENSTYNVTADAEVTDNDGDTATDGDTSSDTTPDVTVTDGAVDEAALQDGTNAISTAETDTGSFTLSAGVVKLMVNGIDVTAGGVVIPSTHGDLTIINTAGVYTWSYTLHEDTELDHSTQGTNIDGIQDDFTVTAEDADGDVATDTLTVTVQDDIPTFITSQDGFLSNQIPNSVTGAFDFSLGADNGTIAVSLTSPLITTDGSVVNFIQTSADTWLGYTGVFGQTNNPAAADDQSDVFVLTIDLDNQTYTVDLVGPDLIAAQETVVAGQGSSFGSGPDSFYIIGDATIPNTKNDPNDPYDRSDIVLISGKTITSGVFNTSANFNTYAGDLTDASVNLQQNAYGVANTLVNFNEILLLDFTEDNFGKTPANPATDAEAFDGAIVNEVTIITKHGGSDLTWVAYDDAGNAIGDDTFTSIAGGSVVITALNNQPISYVAVFGEEGANTAVVVSSVGTLTNTGQADIVFEVVGTDGDGDISDPAVITVQVDGSGTLTGSVEGDVLSGGAGDQTLTGGTGADVFQWNFGDEGIGATDTLTDFNQSGGSYDVTEGDVLDLSDLLVGEEALDHSSDLTLAQALDGTFMVVSSSNGGSDTTIVVNPDGAIGGNLQTIVIEGQDLTNGGAVSSAEVIESLLSTNSLVVD